MNDIQITLKKINYLLLKRKYFYTCEALKELRISDPSLSCASNFLGNEIRGAFRLVNMTISPGIHTLTSYAQLTGKLPITNTPVDVHERFGEDMKGWLTTDEAIALRLKWLDLLFEHYKGYAEVH